MISKDPKISKRGTPGNRKHITLMIPQKLKIIRLLESGKSQRVVMASHNIGSLTTMISRNRRTNYSHLWNHVKV
jgi:hypothetical protein